MARTSTKTAEPLIEMNRSTRIKQLMGTGATNEAVFAYMAAMNPSILPNEADRRKHNNKEWIGYDKALADDILNHIRVCRNEVERERAELAASIAVYGRGSVVTLDTAKPEPIKRISTGSYKQDWLWGFHEETIGGKKYQIYGPPRAKITLLGGQRGVGKTRWIIATICTMIGKHANPKTAPHVLVNQNEVTQGEYGTWVRNYLIAAKLPLWILKHIHVADQPIIQDQLNTIKELNEKHEGRLELVVVDSIKMIKEANTDAGQYDLCYAYHDTCHRLQNGGPHVLFIAHLNKAGEIKGSTSIQHYVDVVMLAKKAWIKGQFKIHCDEKNRYGETGKHCNYRHEGAMVVAQKEDGDEEIESLVELYHKASRR